ncbi:MAG: hypothetical protein IMY72_12465 [Bacteroidetes bacterium]|nr:hypothetical protein [Bacteroidota bacterium]
MKFKKTGLNSVLFTGAVFIKSELPTYKISAEYRGNLSPKVKVLEPKLVEKPPHFYQNTKTLCLYHTDNFKWNANKLIAKEIMSWTIAWLYFYECWLQTNEWYGPAVAHSNRKKKIEKDE